MTEQKLKTYRDVYPDSFLTGYFECALWASHEESDESGGEPMDANFDICDIDETCLTAMIAECADFQGTYAELLERYYASGRDASQAGHDFWLTRNRHGAGFWDRGLPGNLGNELTKASHSFGSCDLYIGDDGKIHNQ